MNLDLLLDEGQIFKERFAKGVKAFGSGKKNIYSYSWNDTDISEFMDWTKSVVRLANLNNRRKQEDLFFYGVSLEFLKKISVDDFHKKYGEFFDAYSLFSSLDEYLEKEKQVLEIENIKKYKPNRLYDIKFVLDKKSKRILEVDFNEGEKQVQNPRGVFLDIYSIWKNRTGGYREKSLSKRKAIVINKASAFVKLDYSNAGDVIVLVSRKNEVDDLKVATDIKFHEVYI